MSVFMYFGTSLFAAQYLVPQEEYLDKETFPHLPGEEIYSQSKATLTKNY